LNNKALSSGFFLILLSLALNGCIEENVDETSTLYVDDDGGSDFLKIQNAIDVASEGDTIIVREGTYPEVLSINKSINLIGTDRETTIINNENSSQKVAVQIDAESCTFKGFTVIGPTVSTDIIGIYVTTSHNILSHNIIMNTENGIYLEEHTEDNKVYENIVTDNKDGISVYRSNNNNISNNEISINIPSGIPLSYGIFLHGSYNNIISGNMISYCHTGIRIKGSDDSLVFDNQIFKNRKGLYCCCGAGNNIIYHNNFEQNEECNARDDVRNQWDNGSIGNYWDDYIEKYPDAAQIDGIWDISYNITSLYSDEGNYDRYPLVDPIDI